MPDNHNDHTPQHQELNFLEQLENGAYADDIRAYTTYYNANRIHPPDETTLARNWTHPGNVQNVQADTFGLTLTTDNHNLRLSWYAHNCLRIDYTPANPALHIVQQDPVKTDYTFTDQPDRLTLRTTELTCIIHKKPFRLSLTTPNGDPIYQDTLGPQHHSTGAVRLSSTLHLDEDSYGLGQRAAPINRRGSRFTLWNTDAPQSDPGTDPLYYNIPFYLGLHAHGPYGLYVDNPYRGTVDLGHTQPDQLTFQFEGGGLTYYLMTGPDVLAILKRYTALTGTPPLPPLWYFGYHQSRFSYQSQADVLAVADQLRTHRIPCDVIHLDIDYMDQRKVFTWDPQKFPSPRRMTDTLHQQGFKLITILDPGIKAEPNHGPFERGTEQNVFITTPQGDPIPCVIWSGQSHMPDFTRQQTRDWWANEAQKLLADGVDGFWNDMNEPAVFATSGAVTLPENAIHHPDNSPPVPHLAAHNLYANGMSAATQQAQRQFNPDRRPVNITRAGFAGTQQYATSWTGDITSNWEHLRLSIPMIINMGLSGVPFTGPDVGGFRGDTTPELLTRWTQAAALMPFFRNHSATDTIRQEPWQFGDPYLSHIRQAIELRYQLMPYLYSVAAQAAEYGYPMLRPVFLQDPTNPELRDIDDIYMVGDSLLVAPVLHPNTTQRELFLPPGAWYNYWTNTRTLGNRTITTEAPLGRLPLFVRAGAALPTWKIQQNLADGPPNHLNLRVYPGEHETTLYEDAGEGHPHTTGAYRWLYYTASWYNNRFRLKRRVTGQYEPPYPHMNIQVIGFDQEPTAVKVDHQGAPVWYYEDNIIELTLTDFTLLEITRHIGHTDETIINRPWQ